MIIAASAHAAFYKAAEYFKIKLHVIPVNVTTRKANVAQMRRAINANTIMLVGSAPNFADGVIDPIFDLGQVAKRYGIGLHVDCCLGSFLMPFLKRKDRSIPAFDFSVDGVTAISCDTHKYGFCPKGSSVIMYRSKQLRKYQYYVQADWSGGVYASPSMAGSRPGSVIAGAYAVMMHMGENGYAESCEKIVSAARHLKTSIRQDFADDLYVLGDPLVSVVAFSSRSLNIYAVGDLMSKKGWHLNGLAGPPAIHLAVTVSSSFLFPFFPTKKPGHLTRSPPVQLLSCTAIDTMLQDLRECVDQVKAAQASGEKGSGDMVTLYGLGSTSAGKHVVPLVAEMFIDTLYLTRKGEDEA